MRGADYFGVLRNYRSDVLYGARASYFHAEYQGQEAKFDLDGKMIVGNIRSRTARRLIRQWAALHRRELEINWKNMKAGRHLEKIEPLE